MTESNARPGDGPDPEEGISLDELSRAYAQALGSGGADAATDAAGTPEAAPPDTEAGPPEEQPAIDEDDSDDPCPISPQTIFEAMLFVGNRRNEPLSPARAAELMRGVEPAEIPQLVDQLNRRYEADGCPYRIESDGPGYRLALRRKFDSVRNKFYGRVREAHLSQAAIDVLAILAYRQPLTGEEVSRLRGTPSGHVLSQLVRRQLVRIDRPEGKPRAAVYRTTDRFLELFGLASLDELPQAEELGER